MKDEQFNKIINSCANKLETVIFMNNKIYRPTPKPDSDEEEKYEELKDDLFDEDEEEEEKKEESVYLEPEINLEPLTKSYVLSTLTLKNNNWSRKLVENANMLFPGKFREKRKIAIE
uniref:Uncharacterized protein n=1 Tax=Euplotes crassus TaxID=5936 RepID=A0A7S3P032_EUPCR|mmetsp:Transcript_35440/g.35100  ORF Transcript_35440/g.35100 Transcript_35440/m.35100 type:complete len:117 (+) Transcript_35440:1191-1541(+)|eukprot:CAMPEP_0197001164 /NCGR_PEP_ID=MMETSP1380-20130617/5916_1 /TAXON_ID=5936 /ORGANISM="Euplotes crassus, Strain CT5" /LENGTH=116 /DNA_ID=CAMNT_0042418715 /DNA_START=1191 /DNA_END=1541 /DNA_ORIENTATION=-